MVKFGQLLRALYSILKKEILYTVSGRASEGIFKDVTLTIDTEGEQMRRERGHECPGESWQSFEL